MRGELRIGGFDDVSKSFAQQRMGPAVVRGLEEISPCRSLLDALEQPRELTIFDLELDSGDRRAAGIRSRGGVEGPNGAGPDSIFSTSAAMRVLKTARRSPAWSPKRLNTVPFPTPAAAATSSIVTVVASVASSNRVAAASRITARLRTTSDLSRPAMFLTGSLAGPLRSIVRRVTPGTRRRQSRQASVEACLSLVRQYRSSSLGCPTR